MKMEIVYTFQAPVSYTHLAVFLFEISPQIKLRFLFRLHYRIVNLRSRNGDPSNQIGIPVP